jgi:hypothetical protein
MMETVLHVGLNADTVQGLIALTGNPGPAWDSYRRLIQGFAEVVAGKTKISHRLETGGRIKSIHSSCETMPS